MKQESGDLAGRAILAIALTFGFYLLALVLLGLLTALPLVLLDAEGRLIVNFALPCWAAALAIGWAILPRLDRLTPPGPRLRRGHYPELFREIDELASKAGQTPPIAVYACPELNAWVADRGGILGIGSRRVMAIGLPLLDILSLGEFRAVLAHEFGHYRAGDTRLGPLVWKTRLAIGRTLASLSAQNRLLALPFAWYGNLFLRLTMSISREQEFAADRFAAGLAGKDALAKGLRKAAGAALLYEGFWVNEIAPVIGAGYAPPLLEGFRRFRKAPAVARALGEEGVNLGAPRPPDPYDSHPPFEERLATIEGLDLAAGETDARPALDLLPDLPILERRVLEQSARRGGTGLEAINWDDFETRVLLPSWRKTRADAASLLHGLIVSDLPRVPSRLGELEARVKAVSAKTLDEGALRLVLVQVLGSALSCILADRGFAIRAQPGELVRLEDGSTSIEPFKLVGDILDGRLVEEYWTSFCAETGIEGERLPA
jgi:Zn-dependent protease with chaperone function